MARLLIVGGGCRGRQLASALLAEGHAARITTRSHAGREPIEAIGAECWLGTPDRLATLRGALENVTIACWLLGGASGSQEHLDALHTTRLELFLTQAIDTTVRAVLYEAAGTTTPPHTLAAGERIARSLLARNAIPAAFLTADPSDTRAWLAQALAAVRSLLRGA